MGAQIRKSDRCKRVIAPLSRVITPVTHSFSAISRGPITPFITGSGAHLVDVSERCHSETYWSCFCSTGSVVGISVRRGPTHRDTAPWFCFFSSNARPEIPVLDIGIPLMVQKSGDHQLIC